VIGILLAYLSHKAASLMSASLIVPFELEYMNKLQCIGWNSAAVMTSVSSSMFTGLMSTMSEQRSVKHHRLNRYELKLSLEIPRFHKLIRRSSAEI
jgi:hypothetical protein